MIDIKGLLQVDAKGMSIEYIAAAGAEPAKLKIQGKVRVPNVGNFMVDFAGDNYIEFAGGELDLVGRVSVEDIKFVPGVWELKQAYIELDTTKSRIQGGGTLRIPTGIEITAEMGFLAGQFNFLRLEAGNLNKPIGATGAFLQSISGQVDHVASSDPNPIAFGGGGGVTGGPVVSVSLPDWAGGSISGTALGLDLTAEIDRNRLTGTGNIVIVGDYSTGHGLVSGTGTAVLNWNQGILTASGNFQALGGLITTTSSLRANANLDVNLSGSATVRLPDIPFTFLRGQLLGSGQVYVQYRNDGSPTNDYVAGWGTLDLPTWFGGPKSVGIKVDFTGNWKTIGDFADLKVMGPSPSGPAAGDAAAMTSQSFEVPPETERIALFAAWENDIGEVAYEIEDPAGGVYTVADFDSNPNMAILDLLSGATYKTIGILNPAAGPWTVRIIDTTGLGEVQLGAFAEEEAPTVSIADIVDQGDRFNIQYEAFDPDSDATVSFFYDTDGQGGDGVFIGEAPEDDGAASFDWLLADAPIGIYHLYTLVDDSQHPPVIAYATQTVTIDNHAPSLSDEELHLPAIAANRPHVDNLGVAVVDLATGISDLDSSDPVGIAILAAETTNGRTQFSIDGGGSWTDLELVSENHALLLSAGENVRVRFLPQSGFVGAIDEVLRIRAWDQSGATSGRMGDYYDIAGGRSQSPFSPEVDSVAVDVTGAGRVQDNGLFDGQKPVGLISVGGALFFIAEDDADSSDLWRSDGSRAGTVLVKEFQPTSDPGGYGYNYRYGHEMTDVNGTLFFVADDGISGRELWKCDGTTEGTVLVKDIHSGYDLDGNPLASYPRYLTNVDGMLFFAANDGQYGEELWKSDGTTAGTVRVRDINPHFNSYGTPSGSYPFYLTDVDGVLFFSAGDGENGYELWKSDGTVEGTVMVKDISPGDSPYGGPASSWPYGVNVGGEFFFSADDGDHGGELWISDGTAEDTLLVQDITPGADATWPGDLTDVNGTLFFTATGQDGNRELWAVWPERESIVGDLNGDGLVGLIDLAQQQLEISAGNASRSDLISLIVNYGVGFTDPAPSPQAAAITMPVVRAIDLSLAELSVTLRPQASHATRMRAVPRRVRAVAVDQAVSGTNGTADVFINGSRSIQARVPSAMFFCKLLQMRSEFGLWQDVLIV